MAKPSYGHELNTLPVGRTRVIGGQSVTRWAKNSFEVGTWGKKTVTKAGANKLLMKTNPSRKLKFGSKAWRAKYLTKNKAKRKPAKRKSVRRNALAKVATNRVNARKLQIGDKVRFTYQGEKQIGTVTDRREGRIWVRSHGGFGRPLGYKSKDLVRVRKTVSNPTWSRTPSSTTNPAPPPKMKRLKKSTGWMKASAVKIVKKGGQMQVLVRKPGRRKAR